MINFEDDEETVRNNNNWFWQFGECQCLAQFDSIYRIVLHYLFY